MLRRLRVRIRGRSGLVAGMLEGRGWKLKLVQAYDDLV